MVGDCDQPYEPESNGGEALDGVTPPMRNVKNRLFKKPIEVDPEMVQKVEYNLLTILAVSHHCTHADGSGCGMRGEAVTGSICTC